MFKLKPWLYLANDITNVMLKKDRQQDKKIITNLKTWLLVFIMLFLISLFFNLYNYIIVE